MVGGELARVAHEEAETLKDERLAGARDGKSSGPDASGFPDPQGGDGGRARSHQRTPAG